MKTLPPIAATDTRFRSLFEHTPELILYQNEASIILDANPAFLKLVEKSKDQVLNHPYDEFLPLEQRGFFREKLREVFATGQPVYFEMFASQGNSSPRHWYVVKVPLVENGRVVGAHMLARDVTEKATAQRLIAEQATQLNRVLDSIRDAVLSLDRDWNLTYLNCEGERLLNLRPGEGGRGENIWALFPEEANGIFRHHYQQALDTNQTVQFEAYFQREKRPLRVDITGDPHEEGKLRLAFSDNGSGFDRAKAGADVFQLYKRFHPQQLGLGIGLFLVKTHMEALGGTIEVSSEVNRGTRFLIQLDPY